MHFFPLERWREKNNLHKCAKSLEAIVRVGEERVRRTLQEVAPSKASSRIYAEGTDCLRAAWSATVSSESLAVIFVATGLVVSPRATSPVDGPTTASGKGLCRICRGEKHAFSVDGRLPTSSRVVSQNGQATSQGRPRMATVATKGGGRLCTTTAETATWCRTAALRPSFGDVREAAVSASTAACLVAVW